MMSTFPEPFPETLALADLRQRQAEQFRTLLDQNWSSNPFWTQKYAAAGIQRADIRTLDDLRQLPLTTKAELVADQAAYPPYGTNRRRPLTDYTRMHQTSGTTGRPLRWLDTPENWEWTSRCWAQIYRLTDVRPDDRFCFAFSFGPFLGFWAAFDGATRLGNLSLTAGGLSSPARLQMILEHAATYVCCTPTYALRLAEVARESGVDLAGSAVRGLIVAGEPGGSLPALRQQLETAWGARVYDHWGMTELGPLATEAHAAPGQLLLLESECLPEILDPTTLEPVAPGTPGELVVTNLGRVDSPLIRYRTGDIVCAATDERPDLPPWLRLVGGIQGRTDDMLTIRGNNLYPSVLEEWLREFPQLQEFRIELITRRAMQHLRVEVEVDPGLSAELTEEVLQQIRRTFQSRLNFQLDIETVPSGSLPRPEMKARRFSRRIEDT